MAQDQQDARRATDASYAAPTTGGERLSRSRLRGAGIDGIVKRLRASPELAGRFTTWHTEESRVARTRPVPAGVAPEIAAVMRRRGFAELYEHQARAIEYALDGRDTNSYSGILWSLGKFDRAWGHERPIFGKVRYMTSENTRRKLRVGEYVERFG